MRNIFCLITIDHLLTLIIIKLHNSPEVEYELIIHVIILVSRDRALHLVKVLCLVDITCCQLYGYGRGGLGETKNDEF